MRIHAVIKIGEHAESVRKIGVHRPYDFVVRRHSRAVPGARLRKASEFQIVFHRKFAHIFHKRQKRIRISARHERISVVPQIFDVLGARTRNPPFKERIVIARISHHNRKMIDVRV